MPCYLFHLGDPKKNKDFLPGLGAVLLEFLARVCVVRDEKDKGLTLKFKETIDLINCQQNLLIFFGQITTLQEGKEALLRRGVEMKDLVDKGRRSGFRVEALGVGICNGTQDQEGHVDVTRSQGSHRDQGRADVRIV